MLKLNRGSRPLYLFFIIVFLLMLVFSAMTPLLADDFSYSFSFDEDIPMESISQIPSSMAAHREILNGRIVAHSIVQLLLIMPKAVFNVLNALNAVLIFWLFSRFIDFSKAKALLLCCAAFFIWNYTPAFGQNFLWLDGAVNYGWGMSFFLLFLLPYAKVFLGESKKLKPLLQILFVILGFLAGAYSENGSVAVIFAALLLSLFILIREKKLPLYLVLSLLAAFGGFIFLMSAPATAGRAGEFNISALAANIKSIALITKEQLLPLFIIYALSFVLAFKSEDKRRLCLSAVLFLSALGSLAAFIFANYFTGRHYCFTVIFTVLACLINLSLIFKLGRQDFVKLLCAAAAVLFAFNFVLGALDIAVIYGKSRQRLSDINAALGAGEKTAYLEIYLPSTKYSGAYDLEDIYPSEDPNTWPNISLAMYYGLDSVVGYLP